MLHGKIASMFKLLNGKVVADKLALQLKHDLAQSELALTLGIIQVGEHPSSSVYIQHKSKMAQKLGITVRHNQLPATITQAQLQQELEQWNDSPDITGYIVQLPLPSHLNPDLAIGMIDPLKDVDGLTLTNKGALAARQPGILPATTRGILSLLDYYQIEVEGKHVVVLGRSNLVGLPTALALLHRHATVTILHSKSQDTNSILHTADIVIAAMGRPRQLGLDMLPAGAIVIDVGITRIEGRVHGDVDFDAVADKVAAITPVPGGVGPLTVVSLFQNLVDLAQGRAAK